MTKPAMKNQTLFSSKLNVAISITSVLANQNEFLSVEHVANKLDISVSYVEQIMARLKRGSIVQSQRGPNGGYMLQSKKTTVRDVMRAVCKDVFECEVNTSIHAKCEELMGSIKVSDLHKSLRTQ